MVETARPEFTASRVSVDLGAAPIQRDIAHAFTERIQSLRPRFASTRAMPIDLSGASEVFRVLRAESLHASHAALVQSAGEKVCANLRDNIREADSLGLADVARAGAAHTRLYRSFIGVFDDIDVLVSAATAMSPFPVEQNHPEEIDGVALQDYFAWYAITWLLSLMGCPIVTVPCGRDSRGMPLGVQVVTKPYRDGFALQIALELERALDSAGFCRPTPKISALAHS